MLKITHGVRRILRLTGALPAMGKVLFSDCYEICLSIYLRAAWRRRGLFLDRSARLVYENRDKLLVGGQCSAHAFSVIIVRSNPWHSDIPWGLELGRGVYIGEYVNIRAAGGKIIIGDWTQIATGSVIVASNHGTELGSSVISQPWSIDPRDVVIEEDVWIGANVVILPGSVIRKGAVIGAGSVVLGEVPANEIFAGVPARKIGQRR